MADLDLDLDLTDGAEPALAPATSRFRPKLKSQPATKILTPKPKPEPVITELPPPPPPPIPKQESKPLDPVIDNSADRDVIEEEDVVVGEFDVFFSSALTDEGNALYVMQYPLRPKWRPYELEERCEEVRVKPKKSEVEIDLSLEVDNENYNSDLAELEAPKQMLKSSTPAFTTNFAVGMIIGKQVHLNPIDAVVQLRPSKSFFNAPMPKKKHIDASSKPSEGKAVPGDSTEIAEDVEPWIPLAYHSVESYLSGSYQKRMVAAKMLNIQFEVKQSEYVNFLCPGTSSNRRAVAGPPRKILLLMPLDERLKKWFSEGPQINRFASLLHLAPDESIEDVLKVLQQYAYLVQGLWVSKSSLIYKGFHALARDYVLFQFTKNCLIRIDRKITLPTNVRQLLLSLAVQRPYLGDWKFKEPTDLSFIKCYQNIVQEQECAWSDHMKQIMDSVRGPGQAKESHQMDSLIKLLNPHLLKKNAVSGKIEHAHNGTGMMVRSNVTAKSTES